MVPRAGSTPDGEEDVAPEPAFLDSVRSVVREPCFLDRGSARVDVLIDGRALERILVLESLSVLGVQQVGAGDGSLPVRGWPAWGCSRVVRGLVPLLGSALGYMLDMAARRGGIVSLRQALRGDQRRLPCPLALGKLGGHRSRTSGGIGRGPWGLL